MKVALFLLPALLLIADHPSRDHALLRSALTIVADLAPETGPIFNEQSRRELPYPLPPDFNECVMVVWSPEVRERIDKRISFYDPPLTSEQIAEITAGQKQGWGRYSYCTERPT